MFFGRAAWFLTTAPTNKPDPDFLGNLSRMDCERQNFSDAKMLD